MPFCNFSGKGKLMSQLSIERKPALFHTLANSALLRSDDV
ncbi:hypothetical protein VCRA2113O140_30279 [Vibrio crassostreae]|nr:hypothetical protein VCRA2113O140_30279 [Vibrio crassostreae]